ncbi:uncharacterized protein LOC127792651 isoform X2 [Diospyros lotus]|uniref:uncharacterized protein LOC127792651 isoform X2 n=1 Tax=Diospyros lotus TaxID=55363 RepID=UPI00224D7B91|nr:uncharacterized protein LOC127792651 isoform X2 [Diospyros lotus]
MSLFRSLLYRHFRIILKPLQSHLHGSSATACHTSLMFTKPVSNSALFDVEWAGSDGTNEEKKKPKKPLHVLFKEAVGLIEKLEYSDGENQIDTNELKGRLRKLEGAVKGLKERKSEKKEISSDLKKKPRNGDAFLKGKSKPTSLYALFSGKASSGSGNIENVEALTMEDPAVYKELSPDMMLFVTHLYKEGYFNNANFLPTNKFDVSCFENSYARDFIKFAAEKFGQNNQEIGKWLSASDLKKVALFGCPSLGKKTVFSAKRLRTFFGIQEQIIAEV